MDNKEMDNGINKKHLKYYAIKYLLFYLIFSVLSFFAFLIIILIRYIYEFFLLHYIALFIHNYFNYPRTVIAVRLKISLQKLPEKHQLPWFVPVGWLLQRLPVQFQQLHEVEVAHQHLPQPVRDYRKSQSCTA